MGTVSAHDQDSPLLASGWGKLTYSTYVRTTPCPDGAPGGNPDSAYDVAAPQEVFGVHPTGEIYVNRNNSNFRHPHSFCVGIRATDGAGLSALTGITIYIAQYNYPPVLRHVSIKVPENTTSNSLLTTLTAIQPRVEPAPKLSYSIKSCAAGAKATLSCGSRISMFGLAGSMKSCSGCIVTDTYSADLLLLDSQLSFFDSSIFGLDEPIYTLTIAVENSLNLIGYGTVRIELTYVPEPPTFSNSAFSIPENAPSNKVVGSVAPYAVSHDPSSPHSFSVNSAFTLHGTTTCSSCMVRLHFPPLFLCLLLLLFYHFQCFLLSPYFHKRCIPEV